MIARIARAQADAQQISGNACSRGGHQPGKEVDQPETNTSTTFSSNRKKKNLWFLWLLFSQIIIIPDNNKKIYAEEKTLFFSPQPNKISYPGVFIFPSKFSI